MDRLQGNKNARRPIDKNTRDAVWLKYVGNKMEGKCYCCKVRTINITDFQVGHVKAVVKGGNDNISNLRPICGPCNRGMGTMSIDKYKEKYFEDKKSKVGGGKITKREFLQNLATSKLEILVKVFCLEDKLPNWGVDREDYIKVLSNSRKATVENIKSVLRM